MKQYVIFCFMFLIFTVLNGQEKLSAKKLYNPDANAKKDLDEAVAVAKKENKHVFLQIGGNWCSWCLAFNKTVTETEELKQLLYDNYVIYHLNYSKENTNGEIMKQLGFPQRFGFPVFIILDSNGIRLHTQNSSYLEEGKGHSVQKIKEFLTGWTTKSLDPANYKE